MNYDQVDQNDQEKDAQLDKYLTFIVDDAVYGIGIRVVTEIISMQTITTLPEAPRFMKGIINLRGEIIPVVDMRLRFGREEIAYNDRTCIVVVQTNTLRAGLIVDQISEVLVIEKENIAPPPDVQLENSRRYLCGVGKVGAEVKLLIDCERLFDGKETANIKKISEER